MRSTGLALWMVMVTVLAACGGEASAPSSTSLPTQASPGVPESSGSVGFSGYSAQERAAYRDALADYAKAASRSAEFYAAGEATKEAKLFYRRHLVDWKAAWNTLLGMDESQVKINDSAETLWTKPRSSS